MEICAAQSAMLITDSPDSHNHTRVLMIALGTT